ncbi:glycine cleavage T C-terminal barrel domain-containing protein [Mesorhizobium japonicum]|uniref:Aminomethyltransferase n=1 Tax=Mesorhizobium japonicum (strain LMG 29417 / CECT 9101 / MAFF 303099) TaxID=266835 RepID=Q987P5_RHILO|nr:glycine cleavage T C-terminal barrel domain-containing protein [Mesorhizobium japonicum]BAB53158.1 aminomethyltransferase [Mesorhizobium japonicum MAFF 303099]
MSVGGDTDDATNPFEVRLGKYVDLHVADDVVGIQALRRIEAEGVKRHQLGLVLEGHAPAPLGFRRQDIIRNGQRIGMMTNCVWSPRLKANIGYALIDAGVPAGETVQVMRDQGAVSAKLVELPFL